MQDGHVGLAAFALVPRANLRLEVAVNRQRVDLRRMAPASEQVPHHAGVVSNGVAPVGRGEPLVDDHARCPKSAVLAASSATGSALNAPGRYCRISSSSSAILNCRQKSYATTGEP